MIDHGSPDTIREAVRTRYGRIASSVQTQSAAAGDQLTVLDMPGQGCCGADGAESCNAQHIVHDADPISSALYDVDQLGELPAAAVLASLGCGNPTALAELKPGEVVLDLGSGGGIDVLLSAKRVGPSGFAYGLDMTDEMLGLAEQNRAAAGAANIQFLRGHIEAIPLPDEQVDVVISNCVINLSADKDRVLRETFRVLKPGGRFAVSDIVVRGTLPAEVRRSLDAWTGCVAGALREDEYRAKLASAGFVDVDVEVTRVYDPQELAQSACCDADGSGTAALEASGGALVSAFVRARKPLLGGG